MNRNVLTISGLDPSGCTGITVELKTLMAWRMYGMAIATGIVSQNTTRVDSIYPVPMEVIGTQLEAIASDIEIHAVKIGFVPNAMTMELLAELIRTFQLPNILIKIVWWSPTGYLFA